MVIANMDNALTLKKDGKQCKNCAQKTAPIVTHIAYN